MTWHTYLIGPGRAGCKHRVARVMQPQPTKGSRNRGLLLTSSDRRSPMVIPRQTGGVTRIDYPLRFALKNLKSKDLLATIQKLRNRDTPPSGRDTPVGRLTS